MPHPALGRNLGETSEAKCPRCGRYEILNGRAVTLVQKTELNDRQRANISGFLFENPNYIITPENFTSLLSVTTPSFHSRADRLLLTFQKQTQHIGQDLKMIPSWLASSWSMNDGELREILEFLEKVGRIHHRREEKVHVCKIKPPGWDI